MPQISTTPPLNDVVATEQSVPSKDQPAPPTEQPDSLGSVVRTPWAESNPLLTEYYDTEWGMPVTSDQGVFERLTLEAFQSGLSWLTILKRREGFRAAFHSFDYNVIAAYSVTDVERLLADTAIIRNRMKIEATIANARAAVELEKSGGLAQFVWSFKPEKTPRPQTMAEVPTTSNESVALSKALKKVGFKFVGPTTMFALMEAIGIVDTHIMASHRRGASGVWTD